MIQEVPLAALRASPLNPRKRFDDASTGEPPEVDEDGNYVDEEEWDEDLEEEVPA